MSAGEAARIAPAGSEAGQASQLLALYAEGTDEGVIAAGKLTLAMIAETATWFDGKGDARGPRAAEKVRAGLINQIRKQSGAKKDAEDFDRRWELAFAQAQRAAILAERKAEAEAAAKVGVEEQARRQSELAAAAASVVEKGAAAPAKKLPAEPKAVSQEALELLNRTAKSKRALGELALPGVAGEVQDYYLRTAMQPSQTLSLAVGLMVPTVLVCANVIGPSGPKGCALQQTVMGLAPTSGGKLWAIDVVKECVDKAGAKKLLGPNRFKSGPGLVRWVKDNRVSLCVQDEIGAMLKKLGNPKSNPCEVEISERMRELWAMGPGSIYNSPVGATKGDDMEPSPSPG
jgi:hypothetical protein